jgi:uncharacterized membrane protein (UPF0127 family)
MTGSRLISILLALAFTTISAQESDELARVVFPNGESVICEIADTPQAHSIGLSRHASLATDRGMLFVYPAEQRLSFWMPPEMKFNLDLIFLDKDRRVIHMIHNAPPCPDPTGFDCPSYGPGSKPGLYVVEIVTGKAKKLGLKLGDQLEILFPKGYRFPQRP